MITIVDKQPVGYLVPLRKEGGRQIVRVLTPEQFERALGSTHLDPRSTHLPVEPNRLLRAKAIF